jgi:integrase/recombinase XerD
MDLEQLFAHFRRSRVYLKNVTKDTLRHYDVSWKAVERNWEISDTKKISKQALNELLVSWRQSGIKPVSINTYLTFLNAFLRWMHEEGYISQLFTVKKLKAELKPVRIFNDDDVRRIVNYKPHGYGEWRLCVMACLLFDTGIRSSECTHIRVDEINLDQLQLLVHGKGQKDRYVPISMEMRKIIFQYKKKFKVEGGFLLSTRTATAVYDVSRKLDN